MPSTYTTNNGIELIATGEQSGTWGATTNTNLSLVDTALDGQVTITLVATGSSGSPNDLPVTDGSTSNGRNRLIIYTDGGDLGGTVFVQLTPNDSEKIVYIRNSLTASRSILVFQGTYNASNDYEIPAGTTAVVYFNGGGTGAVAANVFNNAYFDSLRLGAVSVTAVLDEDAMSSDSATSLATQQSIKAYVDNNFTSADSIKLAGIETGADVTDATNVTVAGALMDSEITNLAEVKAFDSTDYVAKTSATGSAVMPSGTTAQRDVSPTTGNLRFNSTNTSFEGYNGSAWGAIGGGATGGGSDAIFIENGQNVTTDYTIVATNNAMSTGPITIDSGVTVTVSSGARYIVI